MLDTSVSANGSETSSEIVLKDDSTVALFVDGDSDASNLSVKVQGKVRDVGGDSWSRVAVESNEDFTAADNNAKTLLFDVDGVSKLRYKFDEQGGNSPSIVAVHSDHQ